MQIRLKSPIPSFIYSNKDKDIFKDAGAKYLLYRGSSFSQSYNYLKLLFELSELSPSHKTCINTIGRYAFSSINGFAVDHIPGLSTDFSEIDKNLTIQIANALKDSGVSLVDIIKIAKSMSSHYKICGDAWLIYHSISINGVTNVNLKVSHPMHTFLNVDDNLYNTATVTDSFNGSKSKEKQYRVYPAMEQTKREKKFIFHLKNDDGNNPNYGSPDTIQTLRNQFIEYALTELSATVSGKSEVSTKLLIIGQPLGMEGDGNENPEAIMSDIGRKLRKLTTLEGDDSKTIGVIGKPSGEDAEMFDMIINRDTAWYKEQIDKHSSYIYAAHDYNKQLSGFGDAKAGLGGNLVDSLMVQFGESVSYHQDTFSDFFMDLTDEIFKDTNQDQFLGSRVVFKDTTQSIVDKLRQISGNPKTSVNV